VEVKMDPSRYVPYVTVVVLNCGGQDTRNCAKKGEEISVWSGVVYYCTHVSPYIKTYRTYYRSGIMKVENT
jgi:hypothetical protein